MIATDRKANAEQRDKNSKEIAPAGKAVWHRPAVRRLETAAETHLASGTKNDGNNLETGSGA